MLVGIDYGDSHCGLAVSEGQIASPLKSVPTRNLVYELKKLNPSIIVVGVSEGKMGEKIEKFAKELSKMLILKVELVDETLTSYEARKLTKNRDREHSLAAAFILQRYLDKNV